MSTYRKKLIEVSLPLDAINKASAREKSIRHGHPSTLHLWWARRPLAAARAVIFAQMVDDPSEYVDVLLSDSKRKRAAIRALKKRRAEQAATSGGSDASRRVESAISAEPDGPETNTASGDHADRQALRDIAAELERDRLFRIIEELVLWENTTNEEVLDRARAEIWQSWRRACAAHADHPRAREIFDRDRLPAFHDPFAGGGALPLEAQRLGLEAHASDLNPVAVLINKAMIEIPAKFAGQAPVNPATRQEKSLIEREWKGAQGLAEDVRYYGQWMRDEAEKRIGHLYPKVEVSEEMVAERSDLERYKGRALTVIAWLWARTVKSPNPAFASVDVPLASTFMLSTKAGKEAYVEPVIEANSYRFAVKVGKPKDAEAAKRGTKAGGSGSIFLCLMSGTPMPFEYLRPEAKAGRMGARLMAIVAEGDRGRVYLAPNPEHEAAARKAKPHDPPETDLPAKALGFRVQEYGMIKWRDLFTPRQLVALTTFSDLVTKARVLVERDAIAAGVADDGRPLRDGGTGAKAYAEAVGVYLAFAIDKGANYWSSICAWHTGAAKMVSTFGRQAIPMVWDFAEANPTSDSSGNVLLGVEQAANMIALLGTGTRGSASQKDAATQSTSDNKIVSTDPPYYDNIGYADLSDFFYVWLRRSIRPVFPDLFATLAVPKAEELVATPYRHGNKKKAEAFFLAGMGQAMQRLAEQAHPGFPVTIYYAFKQSENRGDAGTASTGWETFLDALLRAGLAVSGTWPMRTEYTGNLKKNVSALASSIVLVCRPRKADAPTAQRREFVAALKTELPDALGYMREGNIAPVDLAQAAIGLGMAVYTRYKKVLDAEDNPISVRAALALINQILDGILAEQDGDLDADSRWALAWFEESGFADGEFGVAETLSKAKDTSVSGMVEAGIIEAKAGKVRLFQQSELPTDWDPASDARFTVWEATHHLIKRHDEQGDQSTASLLARLGSTADKAKNLAYRLYTICERKNWAEDAQVYNDLVLAWPELEKLAGGSDGQASQTGLFE